MSISNKVVEVSTIEHDVDLLYTIETSKPSIITIKGYDPDNAYTVYFNREIGTPDAPFVGSKDFRSPMPISPQRLYLTVYNSKTGSSAGINVKNTRVVPLDKRIVLWNSDSDREFYKFAEIIAKDAGFMKLGVYEHDGFEIKISDIIKNPDGKISTTPARMFRPHGNIEISQSHFRNMTVPMRMLILLHEYAHFRADTKDEEQADSCALNIYLGMGYPESEALYAFTKVFSTPNYDHYLALKQRTEKLLSQLKANGR